MRENRANSLQLKLTMVESFEVLENISDITYVEYTVRFPYCRDGVISMMSNLPTQHWTC
jgi:hypothetical protein